MDLVGKNDPNAPQSDLFTYDYEFSREDAASPEKVVVGPSGPCGIHSPATYTLSVQITEVHSEVPIGFQMPDTWLTLKRPLESVSLFCEGYLENGALAIPLGTELTSLAAVQKNPLLKPGCSVIVRHVPAYWAFAGQRECLQKMIVLIESCCSKDKSAVTRQEHTKEMQQLTGAIRDILNLIENTDMLLRAGRSHHTVRFGLDKCWQFVDGLKNYEGAVVKVIRDGSWFEAIVLMAEEHIHRFRDELRSRPA